MKSPKNCYREKTTLQPTQLAEMTTTTTTLTSFSFFSLLSVNKFKRFLLSSLIKHMVNASSCTDEVWMHSGDNNSSNHREPTQSVCVADCYFIVNVLDLPFASPIAIYR